MDNDIKTWLYVILNAVLEIEGFLSDRPKESGYISTQKLYNSQIKLKILF